MRCCFASDATFASTVQSCSLFNTCPISLRNLDSIQNLSPCFAGTKQWYRYQPPLLNTFGKCKIRRSTSLRMCGERRHRLSADNKPYDYLDLQDSFYPSNFDDSLAPQKLFLRRDVLISSLAALSFLGFATSSNPPAYSQSQAGSTVTVIGHGAGAQTKVGKNRAWADLSVQEQDAAQFLGFDGESWDTDNKVYIDRLTWEQLSPSQRKAAKTLKFNKKTWNDEGAIE